MRRPSKIIGTIRSPFFRRAKSSCKIMAANFGSRISISGSCPPQKNNCFMKTGLSSRRKFIQATGAASFGLLMTGHRAFSQVGATAANDKLNIGVVGVANQGGYDLSNVSSQNIVALCDVDDKYLNAVAQKFPGATTYNDFGQLLDQPGIDAVVVATPDHTHA